MGCNHNYDKRNENGYYLQSVTVGGISKRTRAGALWDNLMQRVRPGNRYQQRKPTYIGCTSEFSSFTDFSEWATIQIGYQSENFEMDKDLLFKNNKIYSKDTIVFIPSEINNVLVKCDRARNPELPIGVFVSGNKFRGRCRTDKGRINGPSRYSREEAFLDYKKMKEDFMKVLAEKWKDKIDARAYEALYNYKVEITD